ncbi:MAG TPA: glycosyltransferase family 2 protein [Nocardioides sp.]|nr:glycosyltransferase family 2 protein [Nocardioides sp.]
MGPRTWVPGLLATALLWDQARRSHLRHRRSSASGPVREAAVRASLEETSPPDAPFVAIVIAALNEEATIGKVLADIPEMLCGLRVRVLVVDDGSTDSTAEVARAAGALVSSHGRNLGQGDGLRTGFAVALELGATVVVTMDADGQHDPAELPDLVGPVLGGDADYVQGSRFLGKYDDAGGARHVGIMGFTALINVLAGTRVSDCTNGYRAIAGSELGRMRLVEDRFSAAEIIIEAAACGLRIREVPVHIRGREVGETRKPRGLSYPLGYLGTIVRSSVRARALNSRSHRSSAHSRSGVRL